ncbi:hypothetical protein JCM15519_12190 [Fundidesulfovibrio butyratiphilus]
MNTAARPVSLLPAAVACLGLAVYLGAMLGAESQSLVLALLAGGALAVWALKRFGLLDLMERSASAHAGPTSALAAAAVAGVALYFYDDPFVLFLVATVLVYYVACLGLTIQFGYCGVVNFSGASFFGVGCYAAALLTRNTPTPHVIVLFLGGLAAALVGLILIVPVLKTRGHYAALVTIAFALLFKTFLEVTDAVGGPQGLKVPAFSLLGWAFDKDVKLFGLRGSFYLSYIALILLLAGAGFALVRRLERSWIGLCLDAVRLDETVSACFGLSVARWKIVAYTLGNFYCGVAGAVFAMMLGFIAPSNFAFGDSLILISIILLGGLGSPWGTAAAACVVILLPEKFQSMQEYRFFIYSILVIFILLFRPQGLVPRGVRTFWTTEGGR